MTLSIPEMIEQVRGLEEQVREVRIHRVWMVREYEALYQQAKNRLMDRLIRYYEEKEAMC